MFLCVYIRVHVPLEICGGVLFDFAINHLEVLCFCPSNYVFAIVPRETRGTTLFFSMTAQRSVAWLHSIAPLPPADT